MIIGGTWNEPGNAGPVAEFHIHLDPDAAKRVLHAELSPLLIPLDVTRKLDLLADGPPGIAEPRFADVPVPAEDRAFGIRASSNLYGIEGFHLKDVLGIVALAVRRRCRAKPHFVDVETRGDLTRGMTVIDARTNPSAIANAGVATGVALAEAREYILTTLRNAG